MIPFFLARPLLLPQNSLSESIMVKIVGVFIPPQKNMGFTENSWNRLGNALKKHTHILPTAAWKMWELLPNLPERWAPKCYVLASPRRIQVQQKPMLRSWKLPERWGIFGWRFGNEVATSGNEQQKRQNTRVFKKLMVFGRWNIKKKIGMSSFCSANCC